MTVHDGEDNPIGSAPGPTPGGAPWDRPQPMFQGQPPEGWDQEDMPEELQKFFDSNHIGGEFSCFLQSFPSPTYAGRPTELAQYEEYVPDLDSVAKSFGCGSFRFKFNYLSGSGAKTLTRNYPFQLAGAHYEEMAAIGIEERRQKHYDQVTNRAQEDAIRFRAGVAPVAPAPAAPPPDPLESMGRAIASMGPLFALLKGGNAAGNGEGGMAVVLPLLVQMMQQQSAAQMQASNQQIAMMMENNKNTMTMMLGIMQQKNNQPPAEDTFFRALGAVKEMVAVNKSLNPPEETNTDKVLQFIAGIGEPLIKAMMAKTPTQIAQDPILKMAKNMPIVDAIRSNHEDQIELVNHFDEKFGDPATTDAIITALGFVRPPECEAAVEVKAHPVNPQAEPA